MHSHHNQYKLQRARERSLLYLVLFVALLFFGLAGTLLAILFIPHPSLLFSRGEVGQQTKATVNATIEDMSFVFPAPVVGDVEKSLLNKTRRIDLKWPWPLARQELTTIRPPPSDINNWVIATLEPRGGRTSFDERLEPIYSNFFAGEPGNEQGLTLHHFKSDSPYGDSDLLVSAKGKVIRCDKQESILGPIICERLVPLSPGVMLRLRFARKRAAEWEAIETAAVTLMAQFTISGAN